MPGKTMESGVAENAVLTPRGNGDYSFVASVSPTMRAIERVIADIAPTDMPVLLVGEAGTGKDVMALRIHQLSRRRTESLLKMSCAGLAPEFFAELSNGSGNGDRTPVNINKGSLFLDEVCELEPAAQAQLLQALPDTGLGTGTNGAAPLGARIICATTRNVEEEMRAGRFSEELYFRINGVCLRLPPLRYRREDIPLLVDHFLKKYEALLEHRQPALSAQIVQAMMEYSWQGNIRELENAVKKIVVLGDERVVLAELRNGAAQGRLVSGSAEGVSLKEAARAASRQAERELILKTLARTRWNRKRAAQELQISYKAFLYKLKQIGMDDSASF
jgi:DNA-binding NtrC family response regulator